MNALAAMQRRNMGEEKFQARLRALDWEIALAKANIRLHSKVHGNAGRWLGELSHLRRRRREMLGEAPERHDAHFETTVQGIPCGVVVNFVTPAKPWRQHTFPGAGPGDCDPPEPPDSEWFLVNERGYEVPWLEEKMTSRERMEINSMVEKGAG